MIYVTIALIASLPQELVTREYLSVHMYKMLAYIVNLSGMADSHRGNDTPAKAPIEHQTAAPDFTDVKVVAFQESISSAINSILWGISSIILALWSFLASTVITTLKLLVVPWFVSSILGPIVN